MVQLVHDPGVVLGPAEGAATGGRGVGGGERPAPGDVGLHQAPGPQGRCWGRGGYVELEN